MKTEKQTFSGQIFLRQIAVLFLKSIKSYIHMVLYNSVYNLNKQMLFV